MLSAAVLASVALLSLSVRPSIAQDDGELAPTESGCSHEGRRALCPGVWLGSAGADIGGLTATQDGVTLTVTGSFLASFDVAVSQESSEGSWFMDGDWEMQASGSGVAGTATVASSVNGAITGTPAFLEVAGQFSNDGVFDFGVGSQRISNTHPFSGLNVTIEGGTCVEAIGAWELSWATLAADEGWTGTETIQGDFTAIRQEGFELGEIATLSDGSSTGRITLSDIEQAPLSPAVEEALASLHEYNEVAGSIRDGSASSNTAETVNDLLDAADRTERALNALANELACEPAIDAERLQKFRKAVTNMVTETVQWAGANGADIDGTTLRRLAIRAIATGAIGPASDHPAQGSTEGYLAAAISVALEARTQVTDGDGFGVKPEFHTVETVDLLRTVVETGIVFDIHDFGPGRLSDIAAVDRFTDKVIKNTAPAPAPLPGQAADDEDEG